MALPQHKMGMPYFVVEFRVDQWRLAELINLQLEEVMTPF